MNLPPNAPLTSPRGPQAPTLPPPAPAERSGPPARPPRARAVWIVVASAVAIVTLGWMTLQVVELLAHEERTEVTTFDQPITALDVDNDAGSVRVVATDAEVVTVTAEISDGLRATKQSQTLDGERLVLRASCPVTGGPWCRVTYTVEVPPTIAIDASADDGSVRIDGVTGDVSARSANGSVVVDDVAGGVVSAHSSNGSVRIRLTEPPLSVLARSSNGNVEVILPNTADSYDVDASSGNGSTSTEVRTDPTSERRIEARSSNGNVTVRYGA